MMRSEERETTWNRERSWDWLLPPKGSPGCVLHLRNQQMHLQKSRFVSAQWKI